MTIRTRTLTLRFLLLHALVLLHGCAGGPTAPVAEDPAGDATGDASTDPSTDDGGDDGTDSDGGSHDGSDGSDGGDPDDGSKPDPDPPATLDPSLAEPLTLAIHGTSSAHAALITGFSAALDAIGNVSVAQGGTVTTTGTFSHQGGSWSWSAQPTDRMVVASTGNPDATFEWSKFEVLAGVTGPQDLPGGHDVEGKIEIPSVLELTFRSRNDANQSGNYEFSYVGTMTFAGSTWNVDESGVGITSFQNDTSGTEYYDDVQVEGTYAAPGRALSIERRRDYDSVGTGGAISAQARDWVRSTLEQDGLVLSLAGLEPGEPAFFSQVNTDGQPSEQDAWAADGALYSGGAVVATLDWYPLPNGGRKVVLRDPTDGQILLEL